MNGALNENSSCYSFKIRINKDFCTFNLDAARSAEILRFWLSRQEAVGLSLDGLAAQLVKFLL